jgi:hypothetical protein
MLMDNHYHLIAQTEACNLSQAMQWLNVSYSVWFNRRHGRIGHLLAGRFKSVVVEEGAWLLALSVYVHLNPVRVAGLGWGKRDRAMEFDGRAGKPTEELIERRLAVLREHKWSSYPAYAGYQKPADWLVRKEVYQRIGLKDGSKEAAYRKYVEGQVKQGVSASPWAELKSQLILGTKKFVRQVAKQVSGNRREQPALKRLAHMLSFEDAVRAVEQIKREPWESFRERHGDWGRDLVLYLARQRSGMTLAQLGTSAGGLDYRCVSYAIRRFAKRIKQDRKLRKLVSKASSHF